MIDPRRMEAAKRAVRAAVRSMLFLVIDTYWAVLALLDYLGFGDSVQVGQERILL